MEFRSIPAIRSLSLSLSFFPFPFTIIGYLEIVGCNPMLSRTTSASAVCQLFCDEITSPLAVKKSQIANRKSQIVNQSAMLLDELFELN